MKVVMTASVGRGDGKLVAVDNVVIKMVTNTTEADSSVGAEPEAEIQEKVRIKG